MNKLLMARRISRVAVDTLTALVLVAGVYLLLQPGSVLRQSWQEHRRAVKSDRVVARVWPMLRQQASDLHTGGEEAVIIEISNYDCVFCRRTSSSVDSVVDAGISVAYLHLPLRESSAAIGAAMAALCAERQGQFRQMHARLMTSEEWRKDEDWLREAVAAGIRDTSTFMDCVHSGRMMEKIEAQKALADELGVNATPTFVTSGKVRPGMKSTREIIALVAP